MASLDKKVLVVEDDKDFVWILKQGLVGKGFAVAFAQDGEEGLAMVEQLKPDLILLDILMPKMDGITVATKIKEKGLKPQIIFLTNLMGKVPVANGIVSEDDYIIKANFHVDQIVAKVKAKLGIK